MEIEVSFRVKCGWLPNLLMVTVAAVPGCGLVRAEPQVLEEGGVHALVGAPQQGSGEARVAGTLRVSDGGCLVVDVDGAVTFIVIWPAGTTLLRGEKAGVNVPDAGAITVGQTFTAAGGFLEAGSSADIPPVPTACIADASQELAFVGYVESVG